MSRVVDFISKQIEKRSSLSDPNHWILKSLQSIITKAGINVTAEKALASSAVFACVRVIAETIASLPFMMYRRIADDQREAAREHPLYPLLYAPGPNPWQTGPEFWEMQIGHNALRGNSYSFIMRNGNGQIVGLIPLNPDSMNVKVVINDYQTPEITYQYQSAGMNKSVDIPASSIWHLKGISSDGFVGLSPLTLAREAIGLSIAAEEHGSVYFKNGAKASGIASFPGKLKEESYQRFKNSMQEAISGDNKFKILLLESGCTWTNIGLTNEDSQFLETRQFQVEDIARIFRVPAILIGHPDKASTYASAEQFMISFVTHTIRPWLVRIEKSIHKYLIPENEQRDYYAEFNVDGLMRGDTKSRYEAYASAITNLWMSPNEARKKENMPPRDGGDEFKNPNTTKSGDPNANPDNQGNGASGV